MRKGKKKLKSLLAVILAGFMFLTMNAATVFAEGGDSPSATQIGQYKLTEDADLQSPAFLSQEKKVGVIKLPAGMRGFYLYTESETGTNVEYDYDCVTYENGWAYIDFSSHEKDDSYEDFLETPLAEWGYDDLNESATRYYVQVVGEEESWYFLVEIGGKDDALNCYTRFDSENPPTPYWGGGYLADTPVEVELYMGTNGNQLSDERQKIYYTTDGTEPGEVDGQINGTEYVNKITLKTNTILKARTRLQIGEEVKWGGVLTETFRIHPDKPKASWEGSFEQAKTVTLSCNTGGSEIYYTLDGTEPSKKSTKYAEPIRIDKAVVLKAIAYKGEMSPSEILEASYYPAGLSMDISSSEAKWGEYPSEIAQTGKAMLVVPYGTKSVVIKAENHVENGKLYLNQGPFTEDENGNIAENKALRKALTANADGTYSLELKSGNEKSLTTNSEKWYGALNLVTIVEANNEEHSYEIYCWEALCDGLPDEIIDQFSIGSQYNGKMSFGAAAGRIFRGKNSILDCVSLGGFGGYMTCYYKDAIKNSDNHPYGIDFIVQGNAFEGSEEAAEPANILVSKDGETWYSLAGSEHYDDSTVWNRTVTYEKTENGLTKMTLKDGSNLVAEEVTGFTYPTKETSPWHIGPDADYEKFTTSGTFLQSQSGQNEYGNTRPIYPAFGYADTGICDATIPVPGKADNPYSGLIRLGWLNDNSSGGATRMATTRRGTPCDISWAVDSSGNPVQLDEIHYIKLQTANGTDNGAIGEKSAEICGIRRVSSGSKSVGKTAEPLSIVIDGKKIDNLKEGKTISVDVDGAFDVKVNNLKSQKNVSVYINNTHSDEVYLKKAAHGIVRIIIQEGEKEPLIYYFEIKNNSAEKEDPATAVTLDCGNGLMQDKAVMISYFDDDTFQHNGTINLPQPRPISSEYAFIGWKTEKGDIVKTYNEAVEKAENGVVKLTAQYQRVGGGSAPSEEKVTVSFRLIGSTLANGDIDLGKNGTGYKDAKYVTWAKTDSYTLPKGSTVQDLFLAAMKRTGLRQEGAEQGYVRTVYAPSSLGGYALSEFTNGKYSGWMYTMNDSHTDAIADQKLVDGAKIVWHYVNDYRYEVGDWVRLGGSKWPQLSNSAYNYWNQWMEAEDVNPHAGMLEQENAVTTVGTSGSAVTTAPTEVKVSEKTNADGRKSKVADVKVSADNQKEILKQAKEKKSNEIILVVSSKSVGDATKAEVTLEKSFIDSIVKDTNAKLTIQTPFGNKTYTQEELKAMSEAATGQTISVAIEKAEEPTDDNAASIAKAKSITKDMKLVARSGKTAKKNIKVVLKSDAKVKASIKELRDLGFTVKYRFYRSTKKAASYKSTVTKKTAAYTNTSGKKGTKYFYKLQVRVYDENGKLVAKTALRQCKYASRTWTKTK